VTDKTGERPGAAEHTYRTSRHSNGSGCVAVAFAGPGEIRVRDSKQPEGPFLVFDAREWSAFVAGVRDGEFDLPT
jgi:hypothetical protein